ncbi:hypothetical protein TELCIR_11970, partial [Teladorsagia circumcincta]
AETCEALELLLTTLGQENGFHEVIDCITAWQDLIDSEDSALRPLVECLDDDDTVVPQRAIALVNALVRHAPDEARAFRIKNELSVLDYKGHLEHLRVGADPKVLSEIQQFHRLFRADNLEETPLSLTTTSEVPETMMPDDPLSRLLADLEALLLDESSSRGRILIVEKVIEMLRGIRTVDEAEAAVRVLRLEAPRKGPPVLPPPPTLGLTPPKQVPEELPESMKPKRSPSETLKMKTIMVKALRRYTGECSQLAPACAFFLRLLDVPDYRLRIDCMILRLEFHRIMEEVVPGIHLLQMAATELRQSHALRRLLLLLVNIGNYLNSSSTHGNAAGFKLSSLWQMDPALLSDLEQELPNINRASESSLEEIKTNLRSLGEQCTSLSNQLKTKQDSEFEGIRDYLTAKFDQNWKHTTVTEYAKDGRCRETEAVTKNCPSFVNVVVGFDDHKRHREAEMGLNCIISCHSHCRYSSVIQ